MASAESKIQAFEKSAKQGVFKHITPKQVVSGLRARLADPKVIDQGGASLCGPASFIYCWAKDRPASYVEYVLDLYSEGVGTIGHAFAVKPSDGCKNFDLSGARIPPVDWIALASLRDSTNGWFNYDEESDQFAGISTGGSMTKWFDAAGYKTVDTSSTLWEKDEANLFEASRKYAAGWRVCLLVNSKVLYAKSAKDNHTIPTHWIVLEAPVDENPKDTAEFKTKVYTWASIRGLPTTGWIRKEHFLDDYFGFMAGAIAK